MPRSMRKFKIITDFRPQSPISEAYRNIRTNMELSLINKSNKIVMITSALPDEGKTTTLVNLAIVYAQMNKNVILVDGDLRKPTLHQIFNKSNQIGLSNYLIGQNNQQEIIFNTHIEHLSLITSGTIPPNPSEILHLSKMDELINNLKEEFDLILIDTPPVLTVTDAQILVKRCDGILLVIKANHTKRKDIIKAKDRLDKAHGKIIGGILNQVNRKDDVYVAYNYQYSKEMS